MTESNKDRTDQHGSLTFFRQGEICYETFVTGEVVLGRQRSGEPEPFSTVNLPSMTRVVVASRQDQQVSREHLHIAPRREGGFFVKNTSSNCTISIDPGRDLMPGKERIMEGTVRLHIGDLTVNLEPCHTEEQLISLGTPDDFLSDDAPSLETLPGIATTDSVEHQYQRSLVASLGSSFDGQQRNYLLKWLRAIAKLFRHAGDPTSFCQEAVLAIGQTIGTDYVIALRVFPESTPANNSSPFEVPDGWMVEAFNELTSGTLRSPPERVLNRMVESQQTILYRNTSENSTDPYHALVTPWFDSRGKITGAFYAARDSSAKSQTRQRDQRLIPQLGPLEASLMELIASGMRDAARDGS